MTPLKRIYRLMIKNIPRFFVFRRKMERHHALCPGLPRQHARLPCRKMVLPCSVIDIFMKKWRLDKHQLRTGAQLYDPARILFAVKGIGHV